MVKVKYGDGENIVFVSGMFMDVVPEAVCVVHNLYNGLYRANKKAAEYFQRIILENSDEIFKIDDEKESSSNLPDEEKEELKRQSEELHKLLDKIDSKLKD